MLPWPGRGPGHDAKVSEHLGQCAPHPASPHFLERVNGCVNNVGDVPPDGLPLRLGERIICLGVWGGGVDAWAVNASRACLGDEKIDSS